MSLPQPCSPSASPIKMEAPPRPRLPARSRSSLLQEAIDQWLSNWGGDTCPNIAGILVEGRISLTLFEGTPQAWSGMVCSHPMDSKKMRCTGLLSKRRWVGKLGCCRQACRNRPQADPRPATTAHHSFTSRALALHHTEDHEMRQLVSNTWKTHRRFWPSRRSTAQFGKTCPSGLHTLCSVRAMPSSWHWSTPWRPLANSHVHFLQIHSGHVMRHADTVQVA